MKSSYKDSTHKDVRVVKIEIFKRSIYARNTKAAALADSDSKAGLML